MSARKSTSRIRCTIDFGRQGRQAGYARAPLSRNTSGWGTVEIPIVVYANGPGPTLLLTGGVHGDEYEGPIALSRLIRTLRVEDMRGRLIIMPAVNVPAFLNDTRLSFGLGVSLQFPGVGLRPVRFGLRHRPIGLGLFGFSPLVPPREAAGAAVYLAGNPHQLGVHRAK